MEAECHSRTRVGRDLPDGRRSAQCARSLVNGCSVADRTYCTTRSGWFAPAKQVEDADARRAAPLGHGECRGPEPRWRTTQYYGGSGVVANSGHPDDRPDPDLDRSDPMLSPVRPPGHRDPPLDGVGRAVHRRAHRESGQHHLECGPADPGPTAACRNRRNGSGSWTPTCARLRCSDAHLRELGLPFRPATALRDRPGRLRCRLTRCRMRERESTL